MLQWIWEHRSGYKILDSFPLGIHAPEGSLGHMVVLYLIFMKNLYATSHNGYTNLHSHQQHIGVPFPPDPHQHLPSDLFIPFFSFRDSFTLSPGRECNGVIIVHSNLEFLGLSDPLASASWVAMTTVCVHVWGYLREHHWPAGPRWPSWN